jgi:hypothetical protein
VNPAFIITPALLQHVLVAYARKCGGNFMEVQTDFRDLLALFNTHKVEYIIVLS